MVSYGEKSRITMQAKSIEDLEIATVIGTHALKGLGNATATLEVGNLFLVLSGSKVTDC